MDGMRGICALYIVLYHATLYSGYGKTSETYSPLMDLVVDLLSFGPYSVAVFIVLSGFVLGLPVAKTPDRMLRGGFWAYIGRRSWRILPPYYAALIFFVLLIAAVPVLQVQQGTAWDGKIPVTWQAILSHLFMVHNFHPDWIFRIDGSMWSVATEWQIYFFFPFLLLLWRRWGIVVSVIAAFVIGLAPQFLLPESQNLSWLKPWFLGLFALGLFGSVLVFSPLPFWVRLRQHLPWRMLALLSVVLAVATLLAERFLGLPRYASESLIGVFVTVIIVYLSLIEVRGTTRPLALRVLNWPSLVFLGAVSYSIYLYHSPLLALINLLTLDLSMGSDLRLTLMFVVAVPLVLLVSYGFYLLVEQHFLNGHQRELRRSTPQGELLKPTY